MMRMLIEMINELEYTHIEHMIPKYEYSRDQELLMERITKLTTIKFVNDPRTAYRNFGRQYLQFNGAFWMTDIRTKDYYLTMATDPKSAYWWSTLFHELSHATGAIVFNRPAVLAPTKATSDLQRAYEEILAETSSNLIMKHFGLNTPETDLKNARYVVDHFHAALHKGAPIDATYIQTELANEAKIVSDYVINNWLIDLEPAGLKREKILMELLKEFNKYF